MSTEIVFFDSKEKALQAFSTANLAMNPTALDGVWKVASFMAGAKGMVPSTLVDNPGACFAIVCKAGAWGMDAFALAQHSFQHQGQIGYEGKIYQAVMESFGGVIFEHEYFGDWGKYLKSGKRPKKDGIEPEEYELGIKITGEFPSGVKKELSVQLSQCFPRLSTNWQNDPEMQIYYAAMKKFSRKFCNSMMLGVRDWEDIASSEMKDITPKNTQSNAESAITQAMKDQEVEIVEAEISKKSAPKLSEENPETIEHTEESSNDDGFVQNFDESDFEEKEHEEPSLHDVIYCAIEEICDKDSAMSAAQMFKKHKESLAADDRISLYKKLKPILFDYGLLK